MKILVTAYACEPGKGSETEVGWQWVRQIARFHETWVITRANNRLPIEDGLRNEPAPNLHFIYVDLPVWARIWKKGRRGVHLYYYLWQLIAYRRAKAMLNTHHFHISHHITFVNMYMGPWLALLDIPFIWGPIGANPEISKRFYPLIGISGAIDDRLRFSMRAISRWLDPMIRVALTRSKRILTINEEVRSRLAPQIKSKCLTISQNAISETELCLKPRKHRRSLKILTAGQLVSIKGIRLSLEAFRKHMAMHPESRFEIIGDGPLRNELVTLTRKLGIAGSVSFAGQTTRSDVLQRMMDSDVFVFPSFEGAGMVVIEAMAKGMPVVCLDFGGPGEYVTQSCGIKVPLTTPDDVIHGLAAALSRLASDPQLYERLSAGAIRRVRENYLWNQVGERLNAIYHEVLFRSEGEES